METAISQPHPNLLYVLTDDLLRPITPFLKPYNDFLLDSQHTLSRGLPLIAPKEVLSIIVIAFMVLVWGRYVMLFKKPINIKIPMFVHHILMSLVYFFVMRGLVEEQTTGSYPLWCNGVRQGHSKKLATLFWVFYIAKVLELFNLSARIVQKRAVSTWPVFFHIANLLFAWAAIFHTPNGEAQFPVLLNSSVSLMFYICEIVLSINGAELLALDYWVIYVITNLMNIVHISYSLSCSCNIPLNLAYLFLGYNIFAVICQHLVHEHMVDQVENQQ